MRSIEANEANIPVDEHPEQSSLLMTVYRASPRTVDESSGRSQETEDRIEQETYDMAMSAVRRALGNVVSDKELVIVDAGEHNVSEDEAALLNLHVVPPFDTVFQESAVLAQIDTAWGRMTAEARQPYIPRRLEQ